MAEKAEKETTNPVKNPDPTQLPAHQEDGLAEKLYEAYCSSEKPDYKCPVWKDGDYTLKAKWRAVANLAKSRGPFDDPDERIRIGEETRFAFQHVRDMAFADAPGAKPKDDKAKQEKDKEEKAKQDKEGHEHHPAVPGVAPMQTHK
jgi:hypothetical protein